MTSLKKRGTFLGDLRKNRIYLLLLIPAVVYVVLFSYIPMGGVIMAFKKYNYSLGLWASPWVGMKNFKFLTLSNRLWTLTRNTILYNLAFIVVGMVMEVGFAIIINEMRSRWFKKVFQSFIFLPYFISWVIASAVIMTFLDYDKGLISRLVKSFGGQMVNVSTTAAPWPFLLVFFRMWKGKFPGCPCRSEEQPRPPRCNGPGSTSRHTSGCSFRRRHRLSPA